jgi:drug/metabolite transporter (DMT)-like permease
MIILLSVKMRGKFRRQIQGRIIFPMAGQPNKYFPPTFALLVSASIWGTVWYPYRLLEGQGLQGTPATLLTYGFTLLLNILFFAKKWRELLQAPWLFFALAMGSGWANYAYVMGTLEGEVMRVLLLFYLAPVWTVPLARWILNERPSRNSYGVVALALIGAVTMLWRPELGWPLPRSASDWFALSAGVAFALNNILGRRLGECSIGAKTFASCFGVLIITGVALAASGDLPSVVQPRGSSTWMLVAVVGAVLFCSTLLVFYAVVHMPAIRAIVIMLFELVVGAVSSHWLAGESMSAREWIGGILIVAATLISALPERSGSPS